MMRKLLVIGTALWAISLTGCDLYYGSPNDGDCDLWGCETEAWPQPGPVEPGGECRTNDACAAGCYCDDQAGVCVETGFCNLPSDCPGDFTCDERATCVPLDDDCNRLDDGGCEEPPPPPPSDCTTDDDCLAGCFCDTDTESCVETGFCDSDEDCMDILNEEGTFDEGRVRPDPQYLHPPPRPRRHLQ